MPNDRRDELFEAALQLAPRERAAFLQRECADDAALHADVASLLAAHDAADGFFESLARDTAHPLQQSLRALTGDADDGPLALGDVVAHYRVDARLGRGGMGVVYRATDVRLGRSVALKVLPAAHAADARARQRLLDEARAASALAHPHIAMVLDVGTIEGALQADRMYVAMVYHEGETLADRLARAPVSTPEALRIGRQLGSALAAAHAAGIVHRDVKPSNVLLTATDGSVQLVDFGIAARVGSDVEQTTSARGTRRYMSPERASGAPPDPRADVWSFGLVLRDLLDARGDASTTAVPERLASLLHRCLDPDPARRPAHAGEVLAELEAIEIAQRHARPTARGRRRIVAITVLASLATLVAAVVAVQQWRASGAGSVADAANATFAGSDVVSDKRVLVLPFEDQTADASLASFGVLAADYVTEAIAATSFADAVPSITALAVARDGTAPPSGVDRLVHVARPVGAAWVIAGSYMLQGDSLMVRAALASGRDGRVVRTLATVTSAKSSPRDALTALARSAVVAAALELDPRVRTDPMLPALPPKWDAYEAYARGKEHFLARRFDDAIAAMGDAYTLDSSFRFPLFYQGMAYVNSAQFEKLEEVVGEFKRRRSTRSDPHEGIAQRILEAFLAGDRAANYRAHREAEAAGMIGPGGLGHFSLGVTAFDVGRPREAISIVRQSDPERGELKGWPSYYDILAGAHLWLGELDPAFEAAQRLQAGHPDSDLGTRRVVEVLARRGHVAAVDSTMLSAQQSASDGGALLRFAGNVLLLAGHATEAQHYYDRAVTHEREAIRRAAASANIGARASLGESLLLAGALDEAEGIFRALFAEYPTFMDSPAAIGRIAARRNDSANVAWADSVLTERSKQRYDRGAATYRRARIAAVQGNGERAAQLLQQAWREGSMLYHVIFTDAEFAAVRDHPNIRALLAPKG